MSSTLKSVENALPLSDRRLHSRVHVRSVAYVALDEGNGGIILDIGEGGMSVHAVVGLVDDLLPNMRLQLAPSRDWLEVGARVAWRDKSRKVAGLQFVDLPEQARAQVRAWIARETPTVVEQAAPAAALPAQRTPKPTLVAKRSKDEAAPKLSIAAVPLTIPTSASARTSPNYVFGRTLDYSRKSKRASDVRPRPGVAPVAPWKRRNRAIAAMVAILAVGSLVAGWEAGRGALARVLNQIDDKIGQVRWPGSPSGLETLSLPASFTPVAPEIEKIGTTPSPMEPIAVAPAKPAVSIAPRTAPENPLPQAHKTPKIIDQWMPSPPARMRASYDGTQDASDVPSFTLATEGPNTDSLSYGSADIRPLAPPAQMAVLNQTNLIHRVNPTYPAFAREHGIEGLVEMKVTVGSDGAVRKVEPVSGRKILVDAALEAVRQWRYAPAVLDEKPIETEVDVTLEFQLPHSK